MSSDFDDDRGNLRPGRPVRPPQRTSRPREDDDQLPPPGPKSSGAKTVFIVLAVVALVGCVCVGVPLGILGYFGYKGFSQAQEKVRTTNNYKQIAVAMHNYVSA